MKLFVISALLASATAIPLQDTIEVAEAKAQFQAAFSKAEMGEHAKLAPKQVATAYLADAEDVAMAKEQFMTAFEKAEKGEIAAPSVAVYNAAAPFYNYAPYHYNQAAAIPYTYNTVAPYTAYASAYASHAWTGYNNAWTGYNNAAFPYYNYAGYYPQAQYVAIKPVEKVEKA